jgi:hypothetical protein
MKSNKEGPVTVPAPVLRGLEAVRRVSTVNMFDWATVAAIAGVLGHMEARDWVVENVGEYTHGVLHGFEAEDPWSAELTDMEDWNTANRLQFGPKYVIYTPPHEATDQQDAGTAESGQTAPAEEDQHGR